MPSTDPAVTDPAAADPVATDPAAADPAATTTPADPAATTAPPTTTPRRANRARYPATPSDPAPPAGSGASARAARRAPDRAAVRPLPAAARAGGAARHAGSARSGRARSSRARSASRSRTWPIPARRGTIVDRNGMELAVSEDSVTVFANPFLIKDPAKVAASWRRCSACPRTSCCRSSATRRPGSSTCAARWTPRAVTRSRSSGSRASARSTEPKRTYPQGFLASQVLGMVGTDNTGLSGLEYSQNDALSGEDGERRLVKDALGEPISMIETKRAEPGEDLALTLDARIQERIEAVLADVGQTYTPLGATAVVMDPRTGEILALANWPRVDANNVGRSARLRAPEPRDPGELRAGLDLQGIHGLGRPPGEARAARHDARRCRRRSRSRTGPWARRTTGAGEPRRSRGSLPSRRTSARVMIGLKLGAKKLRQLGAALRLRPADRHRPARRGGRHRPAAGALLGLLDGEHADRPGHRGHADADGHGVHGDRQSRRDAAPLHRPGRGAAAQARALTPDGGAGVAHARGRARSRRNGGGGPGRGLHARRQDRNGREGDRGRATRRPTSSRRSSASRPRRTRACSWR